MGAELKRYRIVKADGSETRPYRLLGAMVAAGHRLKRGAGPFTVTRTGWYKHPRLRRREALRHIRAMLKTILVQEHVTAADKSGKQVLDVKRVRNAEAYQNPLRDCAGLMGLRQDQGVDYSVTQNSPVYAVGPGVITVYRTSSGWPWDATHADGGAYIAYELTDGPAKGLYVYDAEHIKLNPRLHVGSKVDANTVIATHLPGFANCEMGWAGSDSHYGYGKGDAPEAVECYQEGMRTAAGDNFDKFMQALGAPAGLIEGRPIRCPLPAKYPKASTWKDKV